MQEPRRASSQTQNGDNLAVTSPEDFSALLSAISDIAVVTDRDGVVSEMIWNIKDVAGVDTESMAGIPLADLVTEESRPKIAEMLENATHPVAPRWREVNHLFESIGEFPVRYQAIPTNGNVVFLGHDLRAVANLQARLVDAQRALDEDYGRLRHLETRYRVLFQSSQESLLIVEAMGRKVQEANAAAARLLETETDRLHGQGLAGLFTKDNRAAVDALIDRVLSSGAPESIDVVSQQGGIPLELNASVFRAADQILMLCRIGNRQGHGSDEPHIDDLLLGLMGRVPDAVVLTGQTGEIIWTNDAFLGLAEIALPSQARGKSLGRFLSRPGVDLDIIIGNALDHGRLRAFTSVMTGLYGSSTRVEISVASLPEEKPPVIGFVIRDITRYDQVPSRSTAPSGDALDNMMQMVGTVPLKELVRASTEEIEKMCIEAALLKTGNNRASAAEMLGLSRQSLYVKLRRFGLIDQSG